jgi:hypothetical protein
MMITRLSIKKVKVVKANRRQLRNIRVVNYAGMDVNKVDHTDLTYVPDEEEEEEEEEEYAPSEKRQPNNVRKRIIIKLKFLRRSPRFQRRSPRHFKQL